jgi:arginyl-tRNA synthetase
MLTQEINKIVQPIFIEMGLDPELGEVTLSDRPDLSDVQCNGALKAAKVLKQNPREIATQIAAKLEGFDEFKSISVDGPGFLNISLKDNWIYDHVKDLDVESIKSPEKKKIIIDYGGPNVAKPLHVGHLRSAIIGEAIKRIATQLGHDVISDVHLGDWGTPMGMIIAYMSEEYSDWPYFSDANKAVQEHDLPIDVQDLNQMYPLAAKRFKENEDFADKARDATAKLQSGNIAYKALWEKFVALSLTEIKNDFRMLNVDFDLWLGESDADPYVEDMVAELIDKGIAYESDGALIIDVSMDSDKYDMPPLILQKKDGAATYATTDLATIKMRLEQNPDKVFYVVDQRQHMHFTQVFRAAAKAGYIQDGTLEHLGFGTMNGEDGKPFKTRQGGVMRLTDLIETSKELSAVESGFDRKDI